jgi:hypothetical protein
MKFVFLILSFNITFAFSQELKLTVVDEDGLVLSSFFISKNSENQQLIRKEEFVLKVKLGDTVLVKKTGYYDSKYVVESNEKILHHIFVLETKYQELDEVTLKYEKYKKVAGEENENILDYIFYPIEKRLLLIKSLKRKYYLEQHTTSGTKSYELHFRPQSLHLDVLGNTHIISKDSSYQIWVRDSLEFVAVISNYLFDKMVKNLVYKGSDFVYYENKSNFNQRYTLTKIGQDNRIIEVTSVFDETAHKTAQNEYNSIITTYHRKAKETENVITNGIWDGDVMKLTCVDCDTIVFMTTWFLKIRSKPIECYAFSRMDNIEILNLYNSSIEKFDFNGRLLKESKLSLPTMKIETPIYDFFYDEIYLSGIFNNEKSIFSVNKSDNKIELIAKIGGQDPTKIKVIGNEIYFLQRNNSGFNKLIKMNFIK